MRQSLLNQLCCPTCSGNLELIVFEQEPPGQESGESIVKTGALLCHECKTLYPIAQYVPVMLCFTTRFHDVFVATYQDRVAQLKGFSLPNAGPRPGELFVQESFTEEWNTVKGDALNFGYTDDDMHILVRDAYLKWNAGHERINRVLDVGCGFGKETLVLRDICPGAEVVGFDLNFSLLNAGSIRATEPGTHFVIGSVFDIPFRRESFDLVYSHGVLHHTYSTEEAFKSASSRARPGGLCCVWLYAIEDRFRKGFLYRVVYGTECVLRPVISRLPIALRTLAIRGLSLLLHPVAKRVVTRKESWKFANTVHYMYDFLGPLYAHKHSFNEVAGWFEEAGFTRITLSSPSAFKKQIGKIFWGVGMMGEKAGVSTMDPFPEGELAVLSSECPAPVEM